jgi:hypothetical protein
MLSIATNSDEHPDTDVFWHQANTSTISPLNEPKCLLYLRENALTNVTLHSLAETTMSHYILDIGQLAIEKLFGFMVEKIRRDWERR